MKDYQYICVLLCLVLGALGSVIYYLRRILRIMIMQNKGMPGISDLANLSFDNMAAKKK